MKRDISKIKRNLERKQNNDIIYKKDKLLKMFEEDPDLSEVLGKKEPRPLNKYADKDNPTEEERALRQEILTYNEQINHRQIVPWLKLNGLQKEVLNFLLFDINDNDVSYTNNVIKNQLLIVMCLVHEDNMDTEYGIVRTDLLSYIVRDLLCWSNSLGMHLKLINDFQDIVDSKYHARTLKFKIQELNSVNGHPMMGNGYDKLP
jgi:hypothetical protein